MMSRPARIVSVTVAAVVSLVSICGAQTVTWGAKAGINRTSIDAVPEYYDWVLCCHPQFPDAMVDAAPSAGATAGGFVALPIRGRFGVQGEVLFSRRRHAVDLDPYEPLRLTFARNYVEVAGLLKLEVPVRRQHRAYVAGGPVFGFKTGEHAESSGPSITRGNPETDIYVVQIVPYAAPELLRTSQTSVAVAGGWVYRSLLVELRFTQGLQSIFKDQDGLLSAFVDLGGHEPTLRRLVADFGPFLESAKNQDVVVLAGFRF
jgi:Outer membrane protein beta-barrel domain